MGMALLWFVIGMVVGAAGMVIFAMCYEIKPDEDEEELLS